MIARKGRLRKNKDSILIESENLKDINIIDWSEYFSDKDSIELKKALESRKKSINKDAKKHHLIFKHS